MKHVLLGAALVAGMVVPAAAQQISLGRFFGACEDAGTDTTTSVGEACIIQSIINAASAEIDGVTVVIIMIKSKLLMLAAHRRMFMLCIVTECQNLLD
jgi:multiple sugar transport system substrate-binding protein